VVSSVTTIVADRYRYVVGVDTHAATHSYAIVAAPNGAPIDQATFPTTAAGLWQTWCRRQHLDDHAPRQFAEVLDEVGAFADPALQGGVNGKTWEPEASRWQ
jgi:hypothetical protein